MKAFVKGIAISALIAVGSPLSAKVTEPELVDRVLATSSIKANLQSIPAQLMQIPQMIPMDQQKGAEFMQQFTTGVLGSFNEAKAFDAIRQHFIQYGNDELLQSTLDWLNSPVGKQVTQLELMGGQMDMLAFQQFIQTFSADTIGDERYGILKQFVVDSQLAAKSFDMARKLVPTMVSAFSEMDVFKDEMENKDLATLQREVDQQMSLILEQSGPMLEQQMIAGMAFQLKDLSNLELTEYSEFVASAAGQHYLNLSMESGMTYAMEWMVELMPNIIAQLESAKAAS